MKKVYEVGEKAADYGSQAYGMGATAVGRF